MWNQQMAAVYQQLTQRFFEDRVVKLHEAGKTKEEIHKAITPYGSKYPSQVLGFINSCITRYEARKE